MTAGSVVPGTPSRVPASARWVLRLGAVLFALSVPVALIGTNVRYLFGAQWLYDFSINRYNVEAVAGIPRSELLRATRAIRTYLFSDDDYLRIQVADFAGQTGSLFNDREVLHMRDVQQLVQVIFRAQEVAIVVILVYAALRLVLQGRAGLRALARLTWLTMLVFVLAGAAFGVTVALDFDRLFTQFHLLSFANDLWLLDPRRDHLIQMFPFEFWVTATSILIGMTLAEAVILALLSRWYLWRAPTGIKEAASPELRRSATA